MCKRRKKPTQMQERGWQGRFLFRLGMGLSRWLLRLTYLGREHIPDEGPYIAVANHQSMFDGLWIMGGIPEAQLERFSCMAGSDLEQNYGITGSIMFRVGRAIPIDREGNPLRGVIIAKKALERGEIIMIHPEGTRTHDGRMAELKNGAAYLAFKTKAPIIPVYIDGAYEIFSRYMAVPHPIDWKHFRRKAMSVEFCEPIDPEAFESQEALQDAIADVLHAKEAEAFRRRAAAS